MMDAVTFNDAVETETVNTVPTAEEITEDVTDGIDDTVTDTTTAEGEAETAKGGQIDYAQIVADDIRELTSAFPELAGMTDINALPNVMRYATLRDLGLTATEAYLATSARERRRDNRSHLVTAVSRSAGVPRGSMSREELAIAKDLFPNMSDTQIYDLYKRVKK